MPVNQSLMRSLKKRYGAAKGERVYYAMEREGHPATKKAASRKAKGRRGGKARTSRKAAGRMTARFEATRAAAEG